MVSAPWKNIKEVGSPFLLTCFAHLALKVGRFPAKLVLHFITFFFFLRGGLARQASKDYLRRVFQRNPSLVEMYIHFRYFSIVTLDRLFLLAGKYHLFDIEIEGEQIFRSLKENNKGCLLFVSHIGSFDVMRILGAKKESLPISILMDKSHNAKIMSIISALAPDLSKRIIDVGHSIQELALTISQRLSEGHMVGMMVDRMGYQEKSVKCQLFNDRVEMPVGPWLLAYALKVPVVFCFGMYEGGNRYKIYFEECSAAIQSTGLITKQDMHIENNKNIAPLSSRALVRANREKEIAARIQHYCGRLEYYLKLQPYNWFNFYGFWR